MISMIKLYILQNYISIFNGQIFSILKILPYTDKTSLFKFSHDKLLINSYLQSYLD